MKYDPTKASLRQSVKRSVRRMAFYAVLIVANVLMVVLKSNPSVPELAFNAFALAICTTGLTWESWLALEGTIILRRRGIGE